MKVVNGQIQDSYQSLKSYIQDCPRAWTVDIKDKVYVGTSKGKGFQIINVDTDSLKMINFGQSYSISADDAPAEMREAAIQIFAKIQSDKDREQNLHKHHLGRCLTHELVPNPSVRTPDHFLREIMEKNDEEFPVEV